MSPAGELRWLCRLVDESLSPYTEPHAFVSANKENEKKILISSSQVMRKIQLRIHEFDSASNKEDFEQHCSVHRCLPKIVTKMVNLLTVKSEFVQHVAVNALVLTSEFLSTTILMIRLSSLSCLDCSDYFSWLEILHNHFQELLLQPLTQFMSDQGDCLEGSPFLLSLSDGEAYGVPSSHLQRQAIFLLLDCSVNLISQRGSMENQIDCSTLSSLFTNNPDTELDHLCRKKGLLELYKWIQNHLPNEVSINYETHSEICINFMSSFLQLYIHEDDLLFEVLLQLLSISSCLQQLSGRKDAAYQDVKRDFPFDLSDIFNPVYLFHLFLSEIHYDHQVLLDYLISKDTGISCAKYLLRCMHLICNSWKLFVEFPLSGEFLNQSSCKRRKLLGDGIQFAADGTTSSVDKNGSILLHIKNFKEDSEYDLKHCNIEQFKKAAECLLSLNNSIGNLHQKSLFPYNPEVLLRRLRRFQELCCQEKGFDGQKVE